jgi:hypothetical protein
MQALKPRIGLLPLPETPARGVDVRRVREAINTAARTLARFPDSEAVRRLLVQAGTLNEEVDAWAFTPPTPEAAERVMRCVMAIHIGAVQVARAARDPHGALGRA